MSSVNPALGDVILLHGGGKVEGDIIEFTENIVSIQRSTGGVQQITRRKISEIIVKLEDGGEIRGEFVQWVNGIHQIRSEGRTIRLRAGQVLDGDAEPSSATAAPAAASNASSREATSLASGEHSYVPPQIYMLSNDTTFVGRAVEFRDGFLTIRRATGGQQSLRAGDLKEVVIRGSDGNTIVGEFIDWTDGVFELRADDHLVRVADGKVVKEAVDDAQIGGPLEELPEPTDGDAKMVEMATRIEDDARQIDDDVIVDQPQSEVVASPITLTATAELVNEQDGAAVFALRLSRPAPKPIVVIYSALNQTAGDEDYKRGNGTITIRAGMESGEILIPLIDDSVQEDDESFYLFLASDPKLIEMASNRIAVTIKDND